MTLDAVIATGNRGHFWTGTPSYITCADGFTVSVIAGGGTYCTPRPPMCMCAVDDDFAPLPWDGVGHDYAGPYSHVEVGFPSAQPEPWDEWSQYADDHEAPPEKTVYGYVPVEMVRRLVADHGGEVA